MSRRESVHTRIWRETPEPDNPFAAKQALCAGYDVYGDLLSKASWIEYLWLMFRGERANRQQTVLLERLAVAIANPGPRDASVYAAMSAGVGGSTAAACLMAALAAGAGQLSGAHEVALAMSDWVECGTQLPCWRARFARRPTEEADIWQAQEHAAGFDPNGASCATPVKQTLQQLCAVASDDAALRWLLVHREELEAMAAAPLAMSGVAAAALVELGFAPEQGEMLYLLLRLPGAAVHALEQQRLGWRKFPFYRDGLRIQGDRRGPEVTHVA